MMRLADLLNPTLELSRTETQKVMAFVRAFDDLAKCIVDQHTLLPADAEAALGRAIVARDELDKVWE